MRLGERPVALLDWWYGLWKERLGTQDRAEATTALIALRCHACQRKIPPGEPVHRVTVPTCVYYRAPMCTACRSAEPTVH